MPIYEFKCLQCNECFEILVMAKDRAVEMRCSKCGAEEIERIMSCTRHVMSGSGAGQGVSSRTRNCSGGSCTTVEIPGPDG